MEEKRVTTAVVDAVARDKGVEPTDLPPLHRSIDPDALEAIVRTGTSDGRLFFVEFEFADRLITIDGTDVAVRRRDRGSGDQ